MLTAIPPPSPQNVTARGLAISGVFVLAHPHRRRRHAAPELLPGPARLYVLVELEHPLSELGCVDLPHQGVELLLGDPRPTGAAACSLDAARHLGFPDYARDEVDLLSVRLHVLL